MSVVLPTHRLLAAVTVLVVVVVGDVVFDVVVVGVVLVVGVVVGVVVVGVVVVVVVGVVVTVVVVGVVVGVLQTHSRPKLPVPPTLHPIAKHASCARHSPSYSACAFLHLKH